MKKLVNGVLVDLTAAEIAARNAEIATANAADVTAHIANYRRIRENGGITLNGVTVKTDQESRANLLGARDLNTSIDWKTKNGFVTLTAEQIAAIATAVGVHIQKCFSAEKTVLTAHASTPYANKTAVEAAFDTAYNSE